MVCFKRSLLPEMSSASRVSVAESHFRLLFLFIDFLFLLIDSLK